MQKTFAEIIEAGTVEHGRFRATFLGHNQNGFAEIGLSVFNGTSWMENAGIVTVFPGKENGTFNFEV